MHSEIFNVPNSHLLGFLQVAAHEKLIFKITDSIEGVFEDIHSVEVTGDKELVEEAQLTLNRLMDKEPVLEKSFFILSKNLKKTLLSVENSRVRAHFRPALSVFDKVLLHYVKVYGLEESVKSFMSSK